LSRIVLIHWHAGEVEERAARLRQAGHDVTVYSGPESGDFHALRERPPDAFVIDLGRVPSHGREMGVWLRGQKSTRGVPLVFVEGDADKTERVRALLPDAVFVPWSRIRGAVRRAIAKPPAQPVVPGTFESYAGMPLPKKLGIKADGTVALLGAPDDFEDMLGDLPDGVRLRRRAQGRADVLLLFVKSRAELERRFPGALRAMADGGRLWIAWPKKASAVRSDLTQAVVRAYGLERGIVDYKIAAIDAVWSGLCFARRGA